MDRLDVGATPIARAAIETEDQAMAWLLELVEEMAAWRAACDVPVPTQTDVNVRLQRRTMWTFLVKQGQVTGALKALRMAGLISDRCYDEINQTALNSLIPTLVGSV